MMTAEELKKILKDMDMSQGELARELGVRPETIYRWCKGRHPIPATAARVIDSLVKEKKAKDLLEPIETMPEPAGEVVDLDPKPA